jgi:hypothetical protein
MFAVPGGPDHADDLTHAAEKGGAIVVRRVDNPGLLRIHADGAGGEDVSVIALLNHEVDFHQCPLCRASNRVINVIENEPARRLNTVSWVTNERPSRRYN